MIRIICALGVMVLCFLHASPFYAQKTTFTPIKIIDSTKALQGLRANLLSVFSDKTYRTGNISAVVYSLTRNTVLFEKNPMLCLTPASTTKLFSTASAYYFFGKNGVIPTEVRTDGRVDENGIVHGNIYVVGHGDCLLSINDIEDLADLLKNRGIKKITGNVYGDGSQFDKIVNRAVYSGDGEAVNPTPPITALSCNRGTIAVVVSAGANGKIAAQTIPASDAFSIVMKAGVSGKKRRSSVSVSSSLLSTGIQQFTITGTLRANTTQTRYVQMSQPATAIAGVLANRLRSGGITVSGSCSQKSAPYHSEVITVFKRPLQEFISIVNKRSDNTLAEHVFKMVGAACGDHVTTGERAKKAMLDVLDSLDVPRHGASFNDGSGLSRRNLVCASTEVSLLKAISKQSWNEEFKSTLSVAGRDGTLRGRMIGTAAEANVMAKTGTLRNTSALAGYVTTKDGEELAFAFISNGPNVRAYKGLENIAAISLANFSYKTIAQPTEEISLERAQTEISDADEETLQLLQSSVDERLQVAPENKKNTANASTPKVSIGNKPAPTSKPIITKSPTVVKHKKHILKKQRRTKRSAAIRSAGSRKKKVNPVLKKSKRKKR